MTKHSAETWISPLVGVALAALVLRTQNVVLLLIGLGGFLFLTLRLANVFGAKTDGSSNELAERWHLVGGLSFLSVACAVALLVILCGSTDLAAIRDVMQNNYRPDVADLMVGLGSVLGRLAVVLLFVGAGVWLLSAPSHFAGVELAECGPGHVVGWWVILSRIIGLAIVWRLGLGTLIGFEPTMLFVAAALSALTLCMGLTMMWLDAGVRSVSNSLLMLQSGLLWLVIAGAAARLEVTASANALGGWPTAREVAALILAISSASFVIVIAAERVASGTQHRIQFLESLTGLGRTQPLVAACLSAGLLSFTLLPPFPGFWIHIWLMAHAFIPGIPRPENASLSPNPVLLLLTILSTFTGFAASVRVLSIVSLMYLHESLHRAECNPRDLALPLAALGALALLGIGLMPGPLLQLLRLAGL